jgi:hypothetical protein
MWSKGAQKDYLDTYEDCDEEYDDYYEEEVKPELKPKENIIEAKVEVKPIEVKAIEVKAIDIKLVETIKKEYSSDEDDYEDYNTLIKGPIVYEVNDEELMFDNYSDFSYGGSMDFYKKYKQENSPQNIIKRFGFKKLKSKDNNYYYLDKTLYFIWRYHKNNKTGEEELVRVDDEMWNTLKKMNDNVVIYDRYLPQPILCY